MSKLITTTPQASISHLKEFKELIDIALLQDLGKNGFTEENKQAVKKFILRYGRIGFDNYVFRILNKDQQLEIINTLFTLDELKSLKD